MLLWILLAVTTVSVVSLWRFVGRLGEKIEFLQILAEKPGEKLERQSDDLASLRDEVASLKQSRG